MKRKAILATGLLYKNLLFAHGAIAIVGSREVFLTIAGIILLSLLVEMVSFKLVTKERVQPLLPKILTKIIFVSAITLFLFFFLGIEKKYITKSLNLLHIANEPYLIFALMLLFLILVGSTLSFFCYWLLFPNIPKRQLLFICAITNCFNALHIVIALVMAWFISV